MKRWLITTLVIAGALIALPSVALADGSGAGAPAPPKNAPVDKKGNAVPNEPTKRPPPGPVDRAPADKAPTDKAPVKDKPVDKPAGTGSGAPKPPLQKKSPARHA